MEIQQKKQSIHVDYEVYTRDTEEKCINELTINTPLWVLIVTYGLSGTEFHDMVNSLRKEFAYKDDELVPLELPNHKLDFIMVTENTDLTREFGVSFTDKDDNIYGHELEIAEYVSKYYYKLYNAGNKEPGVGQIYSGTENYTQNLEGYLMNSNEINVCFNDADCVYDVTINLSDLKINLILYDEPRISSETLNAQ